jgi:hypothetical protein
MWGRLADWLSGEAQVSLPDDNGLARDLGMAQVKELPNGDWRLESKTGAVSPDAADAVALCFADKFIGKMQESVVKDGEMRIDFGNTSAPRASSWMIALGGLICSGSLVASSLLQQHLSPILMSALNGFLL